MIKDFKILKSALFIFVLGTYCQAPIYASDDEEENKRIIKASKKHFRTGITAITAGVIAEIAAMKYFIPPVVLSSDGEIDLGSLENYLNTPPNWRAVAYSTYITAPVIAFGIQQLYCAKQERKKLPKRARDEFYLKIEADTKTSLQNKNWWGYLCDLPNLAYEQSVTRLAVHMFPLKFPLSGAFFRPSSLEIDACFQNYSIATHAIDLRVDLSGFPHLSVSDLGFLLRLKNLRSLNLRDTRLTDKHCAMFTYAKHLRELDICDNPNISPEYLKGLIQAALSEPIYELGIVDIFINLECLKCDTHKTAFVEGTTSLLEKLSTPFKIKTTLQKSPNAFRLSEVFSGYSFKYQDTNSQVRQPNREEKKIIFTKKAFFTPLDWQEIDNILVQEYLQNCHKYLKDNNPAILDNELVDVSQNIVFSFVRDSLQTPVTLSGFKYLSRTESIAELAKEDPSLVKELYEFNALIKYGLVKEAKFEISSKVNEVDF